MSTVQLVAQITSNNDYHDREYKKMKGVGLLKLTSSSVVNLLV